MAATRDDLQVLLNRITVQMPRLLREHPDQGDFLIAFAGLADEVTDRAGAEDCEWASDQLSAILRRHGITVTDA